MSTTVAKGFSNDLGDCKWLPFFAMKFIVAKNMSLQFLQCFVATKKIVAKSSAFLATILSLLNNCFSQYKLLQCLIVYILQRLNCRENNQVKFVITVFSNDYYRCENRTHFSQRLCYPIKQLTIYI